MMFDEDQTRRGAGESSSEDEPRRDERRSRGAGAAAAGAAGAGLGAGAAAGIVGGDDAVDFLRERMGEETGSDQPDLAEIQARIEAARTAAQLGGSGADQALTSLRVRLRQSLAICRAELLMLQASSETRFHRFQLLKMLVRSQNQNLQLVRRQACHRSGVRIPTILFHPMRMLPCRADRQISGGRNRNLARKLSLKLR